MDAFYSMMDACLFYVGSLRLGWSFTAFLAGPEASLNKCHQTMMQYIYSVRIVDNA